MRRKWFGRRWVLQENALARRATLYCGDAHVTWSDLSEAISFFKIVEAEGSRALTGTEEYFDVMTSLAKLFRNITSVVLTKCLFWYTALPPFPCNSAWEEIGISETRRYITHTGHCKFENPQ